MNSQLLVGWLTILLPLVVTASIFILSIRSVSDRPVNYGRVLSGFVYGTVAFYAMIWFLTMFMWVFAILIDLEWLPDRYFVWVFDSLAAPWRLLFNLVS